MLTRIRNATVARQRYVVLPSSKMKQEIARVLKEEGFIEDYQLMRDPKRSYMLLRIQLRYDENRKPVITTLQRVSKPGRRVYVKRDEIPWVRSGLGIAILSTPKGVMTGSKARRLSLGGEVLCYIW